jgi:hypothetical protein
MGRRKSKAESKRTRRSQARDQRRNEGAL